MIDAFGAIMIVVQGFASLDTASVFGSSQRVDGTLISSSILCWAFSFNPPLFRIQARFRLSCFMEVAERRSRTAETLRHFLKSFVVSLQRCASVLQAQHPSGTS